MITNLVYGNVNYMREWNDTLMFIDYDGTVIQTYQNSEVQDLESLPELPDHTSDDVPLTSQGWNWTLSEIKTYNLCYPNTPITVGPIYCTTDNKTHIIGKGGTVSIDIGGTADIDWLDGTTETVTNDTVSHNYSGSISHYTINPVSWSSGVDGITIEPETDTYHILCGQNIRTIMTFETKDPLNTLETLSITNSVSVLMLKADGNNKLKAIVLPKYSNSKQLLISLYGFSNLRAMASAYAGSTTPSSECALQLIWCNKVCRFTSPDNINIIREGSLSWHSPIRNHLVIGGGVKTIGRLEVYTNLTIGSSVTTINHINFYPAYPSQNNHYLNMEGTTPPSYTGVDYDFPPRTIYVPYSSDHSVLNAYKTAPGWSSLADIIQERTQ